jgi:hypothetical protein
VLAGSLLPDLASWLPLRVYLKAEVLLDLPSELERAFVPMHSPLLAALWCLLLSLAFVAPERRRVLASLLLGAMGHVALDALQWKYDGGYLLLYPLYLGKLQVGLLHQDRWPLWIAVTGAAAATAEVLWRRGARVPREAGA